LYGRQHTSIDAGKDLEKGVSPIKKGQIRPAGGIKIESWDPFETTESEKTTRREGRDNT